MRVTTVYSGAPAASSSVSFQVQKGHLNGLLILKGKQSADTVTIQRQGTGRTHVLAANVRLEELRGITELEGGYSNFTSTVIQEVLDLLVTKTTITDAEREAVESNTGIELKVPMFYVDLGSVYAASGRVDVTFNLGSDHSGTFNVYAVSYAKLPDCMIQYNVSTDWESTHRGVDSIFLSRNGGQPVALDDPSTYTFTALDFTIQIEDHEETFLTDIFGAFAGSNLIGESEVAAQRLLKLYSSPDQLPADVFVRCTGTGVDSNFRLVIRKRVWDEAILSANTLAEAASFRQRLQAFEQADPVAAKAMRHAGLLPKSYEVAQAEARARAGS